jgi:hypothetical protein
MVTAVVPGKKSTQPDPAQLQADLLRYADDFFDRTTTGADEYARRINTPQARINALSWKLALNSSVLGIATGANPMVNLVDFLALSSLTRAVLEQRSTGENEREAFGPWLESSRILETNAWKIAEQTLTDSQQLEFRAAINRWLSENASTSSGFFRRPQEMALSIRQSREKESQPGSVFGFIGLDPMAGLDPAVREVTRTRLFAERALFAAQRMPFLIRWQTEVLADQLFRDEQLTNTIASVDRISRAVELASQTVASLPDRLSVERKAIVEALDSQEGRLRELSAEVTQTANATEKMSTSLNTTITSFDALMKRFGVGEPSTAPPDTNSPPFNILDYARTADQIGTMAQRLDVFIKDAAGTVDAAAVDKRMAQLNDISGKARVDAKSVLNHAFLLIAGLIVLRFACASMYRWLWPPRDKTSRSPRSPDYAAGTADHSRE